MKYKTFMKCCMDVEESIYNELSLSLLIIRTIRGVVVYMCIKYIPKYILFSFFRKTKVNRYPFSARTKPLYDNCYLLAPDGEILCTMHQKKANW